jgi:UDP-N-acetylmuramyl-tripeptide synthetase
MDDPVGRRFQESAQAARIIGYSLHRADASVRAEKITISDQGMRLGIASTDTEAFSVEAPMTGMFNVSNCLAAVGVALGLGIVPEAVAAGCATMSRVPGRMELIDAGQPFPIIVDYAHSPDSLQQLLLNARGSGRRRLILVFGCGGDRDRAKRPLMGQIAARLADYVIVTNDNPRTEAPERIAEEIALGIKETMFRPKFQWVSQLDRRRAIEEAIASAEKGDVVVIAGKGHEDYQIIGAERFSFDDREVARAAAARRRA